MKYVVIKEHRTNYPDPIMLTKGQEIAVGEKYDGPEDWDNWFFCKTSNQKKGWVPGQLIEMRGTTGVEKEDYNAKELNVDEQEFVIGSKETNGWIWCIRTLDSDEGWLPKENLKPLE